MSSQYGRACGAGGASATSGRACTGTETAEGQRRAGAAQAAGEGPKQGRGGGRAGVVCTEDRNVRGKDLAGWEKDELDGEVGRGSTREKQS